MSSDAEWAPESPPSYNRYPDDANDTWQPTIFVLNKKSIHAESADSPPLYKLSVGCSEFGLTQAVTSQVELELKRLERTALTSKTTGETTISTRQRHIYNLNQIKDACGGLDTPLYFIQATTSEFTLGDIGLKKLSSLYLRGWKALPVEVSGNLRPSFKDGSPLFNISQRGDDGRRYEWADAVGKPIAVQEVEGEDQHRLVVTVTLQRELMDALIALWCCRVWQSSFERAARVYQGP
ncbi:hypothetical protein QBC46DRAFT_54906 [Diplogelasinospora grovesii]|uniref:Uncharacterized protein n=1 Tax=Diplogelasinospora grovesii TaxID=303347 RepID=A0AAN6S0G9_9PEZI|nr:hypothetical protein QBC46DRAFT_54906 [Diplogelasinospora grovesii]